MSKIFSFKPVLILAYLFILGCTASSTNLSQQSKGNLIQSEAQLLAQQGIKYLDSQRYEDASRSFNQALQLDIQNSYLQFFNAHTYHLIAKYEDQTQYELAEQGYKLSLKFDPNNNISRVYLGHLYLDQKRFEEAMIVFADAVYYEGDNADLFYSLGYASYYAQEPEVADFAFQKACEIDQQSARCLEKQLIVKASLNQMEDANQLYLQYAALTAPEDPNLSLYKKRMQDWQDVYHFGDSNPAMLLAQNDNDNDEDDFISNEFNENYEVQNNYAEEDRATELALTEESTVSTVSDADIEKELLQENMVIADVVIISSREQKGTRSGVNILNGLTLQFGDTTGDLGTTAGYAYSFDSSANRKNNIVTNISFPSINYSLNIANANAANNEILARPSLVAYKGETSEFFVGTQIQAAIAGSDAGDVDSLEISDNVGVHLTLTPLEISDNKIKMSLQVKRTFVNSPNTNVQFTYQLNTSKTEVQAVVELALDDTLIISGLSEKETEVVRDGVPILQDIPVVQYLFSNQITSDFNRSVLILVTPRLPQYTNRSATTINAFATKMNISDTEALKAFKNKYADWFKPYPSWSSAFRQLDKNILYKEFRTGDVMLEQWAGSNSHLYRLKQAQQFLYF
jgi:Tfp pilus assembly protein PilF